MIFVSQTIIYISNITLQPMNPKMLISVKNKHPPQPLPHQPNSPSHLTKPKRFQLLYQQIVQCKKKSSSSHAIIYDSKKTTPHGSYRHNSPTKTYSKSYRTPRQPSEHHLIELKQWKQFQQALDTLNHDNHEHIRQGECFLSEQEMLRVMEQLNYQQSYELSSLYNDLFEHLQTKVYDGVPSNNLQMILQVIEGNFDRLYHHQKEDKILPSNIVNKNLKLIISVQSAMYLYEHYEPFRLNKRKKKLNIPTFQQIYRKAKQQPIKIEENEEDLRSLRKKLNEALQSANKQNLPTYESESNHKPILSVDVSLGEGRTEKIIVFEGETARQVSQRLCHKHELPEQMKYRFEKMLNGHLNKMLWKIEEVSEELVTDRD